MRPATKSKSFRACARVTFLCLSKEKSPKEKAALRRARRCGPDPRGLPLRRIYEKLTSDGMRMSRLSSASATPQLAHATAILDFKVLPLKAIGCKRSPHEHASGPERNSAALNAWFNRTHPHPNPPLEGEGFKAATRLHRSSIAENIKSCSASPPPLQGEGWGGDGVDRMEMAQTCEKSRKQSFTFILEPLIETLTLTLTSTALWSGGSRGQGPQGARQEAARFSMGQGRPFEKPPRGTRSRRNAPGATQGCAFFCLLFFAQAKKSMVARQRESLAFRPTISAQHSC